MVETKSKHLIKYTCGGYYANNEIRQKEAGFYGPGGQRWTELALL